MALTYLETNLESNRIKLTWNQSWNRRQNPTTGATNKPKIPAWRDSIDLLIRVLIRKDGDGLVIATDRLGGRHQLTWQPLKTEIQKLPQLLIQEQTWTIQILEEHALVMAGAASHLVH